LTAYNGWDDEEEGKDSLQMVKKRVRTAYNGWGGEEEGEDRGDELEEARAGSSWQQGAAAAQPHGLQLTSQQTDAHHPQSPVETTENHHS